jgi:hypothetical protein
MSDRPGKSSNAETLAVLFWFSLCTHISTLGNSLQCCRVSNSSSDGLCSALLSTSSWTPASSLLPARVNDRKHSSIHARISVSGERLPRDSCQLLGRDFVLWFCFVLFCFVLFCFETGYSPGCPGTHFVDQAGLKFRNPPASASRVLALKACATTARRSLFLIAVPRTLYHVPLAFLVPTINPCHCVLQCHQERVVCPCKLF